MTLIFDTLKLAQGSRGTFTAEQAEGLAAALAESTHESVATKADVQELRAEIKNDMALLRTDMVRWIVTGIALNFVSTAGLLFAFIRGFAR